MEAREGVPGASGQLMTGHLEPQSRGQSGLAPNTSPRYEPTPEERALLHDCQRTALISATLGAVGFATATRVTINSLIANTKVGKRIRPGVGRLAVVVFGVVGFGLGVVSARKHCLNKLFALENSPLADHLRRMKDGQPSAGPTKRVSPPPPQHLPAYEWDMKPEQPDPRLYPDAQYDPSSRWNLGARGDLNEQFSPVEVDEDAPYVFYPQFLRLPQRRPILDPTDDQDDALSTSHRDKLTYRELRERNRSRDSSPPAANDDSY